MTQVTTMKDDVYQLTRNLMATTRLNLQHYLFRDCLGYDINPSIPLTTRHGQALRVAEIGTGTGIWLSQLSLLLPSAQLDGFDISNAQFPHTSSLPQNVHLNVADGTKPAAAELLGQYDVVHLRLFLAVVSNDDPSNLLDHAISLLKPGGYLQWDEFDNVVQKPIKSGRETAGTAVEKLCEIVNTGSKLWVARLPLLFEEHGVTCTAVERKRELIPQRQVLLDSVCLVVEEFASFHLACGTEPRERFEACLDVSKQAQKDSKKGAYLTQMFQSVVGRKEEVTRPA